MKSSVTVVYVSQICHRVKDVHSVDVIRGHNQYYVNEVLDRGLGYTINMEEADVALFVEGWRDHRECRNDFECLVGNTEIVFTLSALDALVRGNEDVG